MAISPAYRRTLDLVYSGDAFSRVNEDDDRVFYSRERMVNHLDEVALATVKRVLGTLVVEERPAILDLMASVDSHLPDGVKPAHVVGLGLNQREMESNPVLDERVVHDLNAEPCLPFADESFDIVLNTVSVDYLTRPFEVFAEVARVLKPGGLVLVVFSDRMFPEKAVKVWREASEAERVMVVEDYLAVAGSLTPSRVFVSKGGRRPGDDRHAAVRATSDPVYAVWAEKRGAPVGRIARPEPRPVVPETEGGDARGHLFEERKRRLKEARECPYCGQRMSRWAVPQTPFTEWDTEHLFVCFNDQCPYFVRGWSVMGGQGNVSFSYRAMMEPVHGQLLSVPVPSHRALRDGIIDED